MIDSGAYTLREVTGTTGVAQTAKDAVAVLAHWDIPHLVVGGLAVQEHGYYRVTVDVDLVVPDILEAVELLTADLTGPFVRVAGCEDRIQDRRNGVFVDLLPAGHVLKQGCRVPFPEPKETSEHPKVISIAELISLKLDSWAGSPARRLKDKADVIELIKSRMLPRDFVVHPAVTQHYIETWDALDADR